MFVRNRLATRSLFATIILLLVMVAMPTQHAGAQSGSIIWTTSFQVQNLSATNSATISVDLIDPSGNILANINSTNDPNGSNPISANGSRTYFPIPLVSGGFKGSAIISSNQPVAAILNILGNSGVAGQPFYGAAANGVTSGATKVYLPLIQRGNSGFNTWFAVQNVGSQPATVNVSFTKGSVGNNYNPPSVTINPGASYVFDQALESNLGTRFIGSAIVTSAQPLAVVVNQVGTGNLKLALMYSGFASGSNTVVLPLIHRANSGYWSTISIQNTGEVPANVTVTYSSNLVSGGISLAPDTVTLQPGENITFDKNGVGRYIGSAVITTSATNQSVVAIVNQVSPTTGTSYEGIPQSSATPQVSLPLLMSQNSGYKTTLQCRNVGENTTTVTLTYTANSVGTYNSPPVVVSNVAVGDSVNIEQNFPSRYVGGGTITTDPSSNMVCIVNEFKSAPGSGDAFLTYNGINY